jgi:anaerobic selenocysteine-containing dehydrogenase
VHASRGPLAPASVHLLSEPDIVARLGRACLPASPIPWEELAADYDRIREDIQAVIPGFDDFNARVRGTGFALPNAARERRFATATGKARFLVHPLVRRRLEPGQLLMMTIRSHDQFNTTIYGLDDRYRGIHGGRRVVLVNEEDLADLDLFPGEVVDLVSHHEGETRVARHFKVVPYPIPRRCAATYFPETNVLVPLSAIADKSRTPASKSIVITLRPAAASA